MTKLLDKASIFGKVDIETRVVPVPEWGGEVKVRGLTGFERDEFESTILDQRGKKAKVNLQNARARLVSMTVVDEKGALLFGEDDIHMLGTKSAAALDRIYDVAAALSGLSDEDLDELLGKEKATIGGGLLSD